MGGSCQPARPVCQWRVRSAAPISPARLPSRALRISSIGRCPRPVSWAANACAHRVEEQVVGRADAAADDDDGRVEHRRQRGDALTEPAAQRRQLLEGERCRRPGRPR